MGLVCRKWKASVDADPRWEAEARRLGVATPPLEAGDMFSWRRVYVSAAATRKNVSSRASAYATYTLRKGHKGEVRALALGGDMLVSGGSDRLAKVWGEDLAVVHTEKGFEGGVWAADVDPATKVVALGDTDGWVRVLDLDTKAVIAEFQAHATAVTALQIDGNVLLTGSLDNSVVVHNVTTGVRTRVLQGARAGGHKAGVWALQAAHGKIVSGGWDCKLKVWDLETGTAVADLTGHSGPVRAVAFDGARVVSGSWDKTIKMWSLAYPENALHTLRGHTGPVVALAVDDTKIVSGSYDGSIRIWSLSGGPPPCIRVIQKANPKGVLCLAMDWRRVWVGGKDKKVRVIDFFVDV